MKIITNNYEINISFDPYGNLYIEHNEKTYQVNINGSGIPILDQGSYTIISPYTKEFKQIIQVDKSNPLQKKIKKKLEQQEDNENNNSDDEYFLDEHNEDYCPEDQDHIINQDESDDNISIDENTIEKYGEHNYKFDFWNADQGDVYYREDGDITSLYDTYIYNSDRLIFKSHSINDSSIYRFRIYINGDIYYRPIGGIEKKCKIDYNNNELILFMV